MNFFSRYSLLVNIFSIIAIVSLIFFISAKSLEDYNPNKDHLVKKK